MTVTDLTKWPRLLVVGKPVTRQQANEILIRTNIWPLFTNDGAWEQQVYDLLAEHGGPTVNGYYGGWDRTVWDQFRYWRQDIVGCLNLHYLHNARIASSWIGGPHGWCDWDGRIGCANYNIGKWPTVEEVTDDWLAIAAAFPYLELRAQLVPDEGDAGVAAAQWRVAAGQVEVVEPGPLLADPADPEYLTVLLPAGERGVSADRLREALAQVTSR